MSSLTAHLREAGDHGQLPFHRDCPVCRDERLAGTLPDAAIVSPRLRAVLATTALAASAAPPTTTALAGGPPAIRQSDEPRPPAGTRGEDGPGTAGDHGRGGSDRDANGQRDRAAPPEPAAPARGQALPEPATGRPDLDAAASRPADPRRPPTPQGPEPPQPPAEQATPPSRADAPASGDAAEPTPERGERSSATPPDPSPARSARGLSERDRRGADSEGRQQRGSAVHVVERGECLWTIAEERLGRDASDAAIAREVTQIWQHNERRLRSGDPDLIFPGERLRVTRG